MALPRPVLATALACVGSLALVGPAQAATSSAAQWRVLAETLSATAKKQFNKDTSVIGSDPFQTIRNLSAIIAPKPDPACLAQATSKPFAPWNDTANYVPVPNSGFEHGLTDWTATGKVLLTGENNPFYISGRQTDASSVVVPLGSSVASASFCGGIEYPTIRMMTKSTSGRTAKASVIVRYTGRDGLVGALPLGTVTAGPDWAPSEITLTASGIPLFTGTKLGVTIMTTSGSIAIDDVYVDPYRRT